jgi:hypothetical protein
MLSIETTFASTSYWLQVGPSNSPRLRHDAGNSFGQHQALRTTFRAYLLTLAARKRFSGGNPSFTCGWRRLSSPSIPPYFGDPCQGLDLDDPRPAGLEQALADLDVSVLVDDDGCRAVSPKNGGAILAPVGRSMPIRLRGSRDSFHNGGLCQSMPSRSPTLGWLTSPR